MNTYKNLEIYQEAFNLAIKVYRLNVTLTVTALLNQGNRLRWTSLKIKDLIAEGFSGSKSDEEVIKVLNHILNLNNEVLMLLKKIKLQNNNNKQIPEFIKGYRQLSQKVRAHIYSLSSTKNDYVIPFPESVMMDMAG
ncbi:MAG: four helix bundle protein [Bacteroidales bacterium]|nr:four helix bundle protein [Bacteroidales bacterium]MCF8403351.1 four helix bundle protein [Bacteroidales bacterium]